MSNQETNTVYIDRIIYTSYTPSQKKAILKYQSTHTDRINARAKELYHASKLINKPFLDLLILVKAFNHPEFIPKPHKKKLI